MKRTILKTGLTLFAIGAMSLVGFNAAYGYCGSGGGTSSCQNVSYSEWGTCVDGVQYRNVISTNPRQCDLSASQQLQRSKTCVVANEEGNTGNVQENGQVSGQRQYAEGTLLRGSDGKVYIVKNGALKYIAGLSELRQYTGREILNVNDSEIFAFAQGVVKGDQKYAEGTLLRGSDNKIYVLIGGNLKHIVHLDTLKKYYAGHVILNVDNSVIVSFGGKVLGANKYSEGTLLRGSDYKIYVVQTNGLKQILTLSALRNTYASKEILNVSDEVIEGLK